jgi:hypothetical protein
MLQRRGRRRRDGYLVRLQSRPLAGVAVFGLLCLVIVGVGGFGASRSDGARGAAMDAGSRERSSSAQLQQVHRMVAARGAWQRRLESPRAVAQRAWSRMSFHGLSAGAAQGLLMRDYGSVLSGVSANPAASVAAAGRIVRYIGDDVALVRAADGSLEREISSVPLRVSDGVRGEQPVSLALRKSGAAFAPANPLHGLSISERLGGGVALESSSIRFIPQGADAHAHLVGDSSVFYPEVGLDEDASVSPTINGVELSTVLRSRLSPQQISYKVVLPAGAVMRSSGAGAVISDGMTEVHVLAPTARDAQGRSVPVKMTVSGDRLVLYVPHREGSVAYPLLVDPSVTTNHCCGEWQFTGPNWEPRNGEYLNNSEWVIQPGILEAKVAATHRLFSAFLGWGNDWQESHGWQDIRAELGGIEYVPGTAETGSATAADIEGFCGSWSSSKGAPPSKMAFSPPEGCLQGFGMELRIEKHLTSAALLTVGSVLVTARSAGALKHHRRRGVRHREVMGPNNPGDPELFRVCEGDPVDCSTGNETETQTDVEIPGLGVPLALTRTYNSQEAVTQSSPGPFGYGWSSSFSDHLKINTEAKTVTVEQANGSDVVFTGNPREAGELNRLHGRKPS